MAKCCRVPEREVKDILAILYAYEPEVTTSVFTETLLGVGNRVTERSMMKISARLAAFQRRMETMLLDVMTQLISERKMLDEQTSQLSDLLHQSHESATLMEEFHSRLIGV